MAKQEGNKKEPVKKPNLNTFNKGLNLDTSQENSPKGTYRFALNAVNETELGDLGSISNEESNELCVSLKEGYIILEKIYMGSNEFALLSVSADNTVSEIGIFKSHTCEYEEVVNDENSPANEKLNFKKEHQIQGTYRLRRGCEKTIYFTDNFNPVRYFNFNKLNNFKNSTTNNWDSDKFKLFRTANSFPKVGNVSVLEGQGNLTPGNYSVLVQYLDEDFNGTQFLEIINNIHIYNDSTENLYYDINGSSAINIQDSAAYKYEDTNKAISITLQDLDSDFPYIRFAFVEYTTGVGTVTSIKYSDIISVVNPSFIYTGKNGFTSGTLEEVQFSGVGAGINRAAHIEQLENRLLLANTGGTDVKLHKLQKYASKIQTDCIVKQIVLTNIDEQHNSKNPLVNYHGVSYQPGEIYSLGIIYLFNDFTVSPVYHIPGKGPTVAEDHKYTSGTNVYPMSKIDNNNNSETYLETNNCDNETYWGKDAEDIILQNKFVRHHRFPTRAALSIPLVSVGSSTETTTQYNIVNLFIEGTPKQSLICDPEDVGCTEYIAPRFTLIVKYDVDGVNESFSTYINPDGSIVRNINSNLYTSDKVITNIKLYYVEELEDEDDEVEVEILLDGSGNSSEQDNLLTYHVSLTNSTEQSGLVTYTGHILGLKFSNITFPTAEEIGKEVIGYQIVRQERKEHDRTILDSGVLFPMMKHDNFISHGWLNPELENNPASPYYFDKHISKRSVALLSPRHKFTDITFDNFTSIEEVGMYNTKNITATSFQIQDILEGSTADEINTTPQTDDNDGYTLKHAVRYTEVEYVNPSLTPINIPKTNTRIYNLNAVNYAESSADNNMLYNLSCDNKMLILDRKVDDINIFQNAERKFPYVYIKKDHQSFYQNFRSAAFYTTSDEIFKTSTCQVFGGDIHITPLRYSNHVFLNVVAAIRKEKQSLLKIIGAIVAVIVATIASILIPPAGAVAWGAIVGAGLLGLGGLAFGAAAIIENEKFISLYTDKWYQGLDKTLYDKFYQWQFIDPDASDWSTYGQQLWYRDDTFNWMGEVVGDLWFESTMNMSLRVPPRSHSTNFLNPLKPHMGDNPSKTSATARAYYDRRPRGYRFNDDAISQEGDVAQYFYNKLFSPDSTSNKKIKYNGISLPVVYVLNGDFNVTSKIKTYYPLPLTYDGCSDCSEKFPHRIYYSNQSFQEEKTDNYRTFLPNNYRDIEGETGEITNIFRYYNNLFIHTKEALWQMPRSYQERVTDQIVSFIGTGSYFEVPPQKILDDSTGSSAGTQHKWSGIKTPEGYFFVSENQGDIYQFDGRKLAPISSLGLSNWFRTNLEIKGTGLKDNPSNPEGSGFISTYDPAKHRIIFTKVDKIQQDEETLINNSWTISYSLKNKTWTSWHSYLPSFYINSPEGFYSITTGNSGIWKHNIEGNYQTYYGTYYPYTIDYTSVSSPLVTRVWESLTVPTVTKEFDNELKSYKDIRDITFNKLILYNSRQCSGELNLMVKDTDLGGVDYLFNQVNGIEKSESIIDRTERDWSINDFRDMRVDYNTPIWDQTISSKQQSYYTDKVLNTSSIDPNKDWTQMESFRDKYLGIRLIFDKFADKKIIITFSIENEDVSPH